MTSHHFGQAIADIRSAVTRLHDRDLAEPEQDALIRVEHRLIKQALAAEAREAKQRSVAHV